MPSKKKKYNARFPPVSTWPGRSGCSSREARAQARLVGRAHRGVRGPGRPAPFRALPASVPPAPFLPGYPSRFPQHPFLGQRRRGPTSPLPPQARIKKIMQTDEEIGKVAAAVPVIISRALELFLESLLKKACQVTQSRNAKTMTTSHL